MNRVINRLKHFDLKRMIKMIKVVQERSNHSFLHIFLDILRCFILFGSGYMDYYLFYFEDLTDDEKSTYITQAVNKRYIKDLNDPKYYNVLDDKAKFLNTYKDFINRDFIDLRVNDFDDFISFVNKHPLFIAKPLDGLCGYGVELIDSSNQDLKSLYNKLIDNGQKLLEEKIIQNEEINKIYDKSINTIRVVTLNKNDDVKILFTAMRIGNNNKVVDNFNNGGLMAVIDDDGVIRKPVLDKDNRVYDSHPMTGSKIVGFAIPRFNEIIDLCKKLAKVTPELGLVGFDIAVTDTGLDVVEGNQFPGYDIYQSKEQLLPSRKGIKKKFDDAIYPEKRNRYVFAKGFNLIKLVWIFTFALLVEYLLSLINIFIPLTFTSFVSYLFIYKHIDTFSFKNINLLLVLFGLIQFILDYLLLNFSYFINLSDFSIFYYLNNYPSDVILLLATDIIGVLLFGIIVLYFLIPFLNKYIEKANKYIGLLLTFIFGLISLFFISTLFFIVFEILLFL